MMIILQNLHFLLFGPYPDGQLGGLALTLVLSLIVGLGSLLVGLLVATLSMSSSRGVRMVSQTVPAIIRSLPSLVFLFWLYFLLPAITKIDLSPLTSSAIALSIYQGAFIAEDIRGGLNSVAKGHIEAGSATGLSVAQTFWYIRLPQAVRATIPALANRYINLFLYTSTASVVGVMEFTRTSTLVSNRVLVHPIEIYGFAALVYFIFCYGIAALARYFERRWDWSPKVTRSPVSA
jgi:polar amino acid transport system permease protein